MGTKPVRVVPMGIALPSSVRAAAVARPYFKGALTGAPALDAATTLTPLSAALMRSIWMPCERAAIEMTVLAAMATSETMALASVAGTPLAIIQVRAAVD